MPYQLTPAGGRSGAGAQRLRSSTGILAGTVDEPECGRKIFDKAGFNLILLQKTEPGATNRGIRIPKRVCGPHFRGEGRPARNSLKDEVGHVPTRQVRDRTA